MCDPYQTGTFDFMFDGVSEMYAATLLEKTSGQQISITVNRVLMKAFYCSVFETKTAEAACIYSHTYIQANSFE